jgi:phage terminase large subunit GpA-like protein
MKIGINYLELTAEKKVTQYKNGFPAPVWVKLRERNEALDCEVYALVAAYRSGMALINWDKLREKRVNSVQTKKVTRKKKRPVNKREPKW